MLPVVVSSSIGAKDDQGRTVVKFGPLFMAYQVRQRPDTQIGGSKQGSA